MFDLRLSLTCAQFRLKYLLNQSDIFAHFGLGNNAKNSSKTGKSEDWDEDDEALVKDVEEDEHEPSSHAVRATVLTQQPTCLTGVTMRFGTFMIALQSLIAFVVI